MIMTTHSDNSMTTAVVKNYRHKTEKVDLISIIIKPW